MGATVKIVMVRFRLSSIAFLSSSSVLLISAFKPEGLYEENGILRPLKIDSISFFGNLPGLFWQRENPNKTVTVPDQNRLKELHAFNVDDVMSYELTNKFHDYRQFTQCVFKLIESSPSADDINMWPILGTAMAVYRGFHAPWDHDLDFAYEATEAADRALLDTFSGDLTSSLKLHPEFNGISMRALIENGQVQHLLHGRHLVMDVWRWTPQESSEKVPDATDLVCGWICLKRTEIYPTSYAQLGFFEPDNSSSEGYKVRFTKVPTARNISAFIDRYPPFKGARTDLPYNHYNNDKAVWQFDENVHVLWNKGLGPPVVF